MPWACSVSIAVSAAKRGVAVVARAAAEEPIAAAHRRPWATVGRPSPPSPAACRKWPVEEHGLAALARHFHEDDRGPALEADHVDGSGPRSCDGAGPVGHEG